MISEWGDSIAHSGLAKNVSRTTETVPNHFSTAEAVWGQPSDAPLNTEPDVPTFLG